MVAHAWGDSTKKPTAGVKASDPTCDQSTKASGMEVGTPSGKDAYELCIPGVSAAVGGSRRVATPVRNACLENDKGLPVPAALETPGSGSASASEAKASEALEVEIATELEALTDFEWQLQQLHDLEHEERQLQEEWKLLEEIDMAEKELAQLRISDPEEAVDATAQTSAELTKAAVLPQEAVMHAKVNDQVVSYLFGEFNLSLWCHARCRS